MTKAERQKALALNQVRTGYYNSHHRFITALIWLTEHQKDKPLTKRQKLFLDQLVYRYRSQLANQLPDALMILTPPNPADYGLAEDPDTGQVQDLFDGTASKPHPTASIEAIHHPQKNLF